MAAMTEQEQVDLHRLTKHYRENYQVDVDAGLDRLHRRMGETSPRKPQFFSYWRAIAAGLTLLMLAGIGYANFGGWGEEYYASDNETQIVELADGTQVTLNRYSELTVPASFGDGNREVVLSGEAFFDVHHDPTRPFIVKQEDVSLKVLGTSFNLRTVPGKSFFEVEVATGKVELTTPSNRIEVKAKHCGRYLPGEGLATMPAPHLNRRAWLTRHLKFEATPIQEVLDMLERTYEVRFTLNDSEKGDCNFPFNGDFKNVPLDQILEEILVVAGKGEFTKLESADAYALSDWCGNE